MGLFSKEASDDAQRYELNNKVLKCHHCENDTFFTRTEQLHTPRSTLFNMEWMDKTASCFICSECGYIHWFLR